MKKLVMVEVLSQFRIRYAVEVKENVDHALDEFVVREGNADFKEFSQEHLGTTIVSHREITKEEYLRMFDEDNDYLKGWSEQNKLNWINKINYGD